MIKVVQVGLGSIGLECTRLLLSRPDLKLIGCVDIDPEKVGKDLASLLGTGKPLDLRVEEDITRLKAELKGAVAIHTTKSFLKEIAPQIFSLLNKGLNIVSSAEELLLPFFTDSSLAERIDRKAKEKGVTVLGTGINPGFLLDYLPLILSGICQKIERIKATRVVDAATRRQPLQAKVGAGIVLKEFEERKANQTIGHVGLRESVAFLAEGLGWKLEKIEQELEAVVADRDYQTRYFSIPQGSVAGIKEVARGIVKGKERILLDLRMFVGAPAPYDAIIIEGEPRLEIKVEGGTPGDEASVAALVNSVVQVAQAPPGLMTMKDLPPRSGERN